MVSNGQKEKSILPKYDKNPLISFYELYYLDIISNIKIITHLMNPSQLIENRSVQLIFRDCLKLAPRMVDDPVRVQAIRRLLKH